MINPDFQLLFESAQGLYLVLLPNPPLFTIVAASDAYARQTMTVREQIIGRGLFEVFPMNPDEQSTIGFYNLKASLNKVIEKKTCDTLALIKYDIPAPAGEKNQYEERYWSPVNCPVFDSQGNLTYIIHKTEDVTDFIQQTKLTEELRNQKVKMESEILIRAQQIQDANQKLERIIKDREDILAIVSHDLKNPLTAIDLNLQMISKIANEQSKILSIVKNIQKSTDQMERLINDLMDFSKIQIGILTIEKKEDAPDKIIETVYEMMKTQAEKKELNFFTEVNSGLPKIQCDSQRIVQALANLIGNSIKFTDNGGSIKVSVENTIEGVIFSVNDTGPGISSENLPKVFERYWQSKNTNNSSAGLGLSITKGIVDAHGGKIWVESQLEKGSTFYFLLPHC